MKIELNKIPLGGLTLEEEFTPAALDLETEILKFHGPIKVRADITKITNAVTAHLGLNASMYTVCSRCLQDFEIDFKKEIDLNYSVDRSDLVIDMDPDIREELIIDYPIKPLCRYDCKGLCAKCGKNLNEGECKCVSL